MKRKVIAALLCFMLIGSVSCFAIEPEKKLQSAELYTADLYYCDSVRNKVVLKGVGTFGSLNDTQKEIITTAEYNELDIVCGGVLKDGAVIGQAELNRYADSRVAVVLARTADGTVIVAALRFL